jgi:hypothetical protein
MPLEQLKEKLIEGHPNDLAVPLCLQILDYLDRLPPQETRQLSPLSLANGIDHPLNELLLRAITILVAGAVDVLDTRVLFIDDDQAIDIDTEELKHARDTGSLVHPMTGELVQNYEEKLFPYFVPSENFSRSRDIR